MLKQITIFLLVVAAMFGMYFYFNNQPLQSPNYFVTAKGQQLFMHGQPFRSVGVNRYNLLTQNVQGNDIGCANSFSDGQLTSLFSQMHSLGITTVRFWLFQSFTKSGDDTSRLAYVLSLANQNNIKVIPVLENHWADCSKGGEKDASWYASGYQAPYGTYPLSLNAYVKKIVPLYKNDPSILSWEIINEAQDDNIQDLTSFATDISQEIKSLDPNHLVSISLNNTDQFVDVTEKLSEIKTIDFVAYHDYANDTVAIPDQLQEAIAIAKKNNKPLVVGEAGIQKTVPNRADLFAAKMNEFFQNGGDAYLIWSYGDTSITNDGYNFTSSDPVAQIVKQTVGELNK